MVPSSLSSIDGLPETDGPDEDLIVQHDGRSGATSGVVATDRAAFYLPFHQFERWGIYVLARGVIGLAKALKGGRITAKDPEVSAAVEALIQHETFHFEAELAATTMETLVRRPVYEEYAASPASLLHEEAMAEAAMLRQFRASPLLPGLIQNVAGGPLGYREGVYYWRQEAYWIAGLRELAHLIAEQGNGDASRAGLMGNAEALFFGAYPPGGAVLRPPLYFVPDARYPWLHRVSWPPRFGNMPVNTVRPPPGHLACPDYDVPAAAVHLETSLDGRMQINIAPGEDPTRFFGIRTPDSREWRVYTSESGEWLCRSCKQLTRPSYAANVRCSSCGCVICYGCARGGGRGTCSRACGPPHELRI